MIRPLPPRTFYRVWSFFILEFHVMAVLLWGWGNFYALTSVCLSHAALSLLEQMAGAWTQRAPGAPCCAVPRRAFLNWAGCPLPQERSVSLSIAHACGAPPPLAAPPM